MATTRRDKRPQHQSQGQWGVGGWGQLLRGGELELLWRVRSRPGRKNREAGAPGQGHSSLILQLPVLVSLRPGSPPKYAQIFTCVS